jgi:hypothetical protein
VFEGHEYPLVLYVIYSSQGMTRGKDVTITPFGVRWMNFYMRDF